MGVPAMWTKHRPLALALAREFWFPDGDADDVRQTALVALWEACRQFDPTLGAFRPFAEMVVRRTLMDEITARNRHKRRLLTDAVRVTVNEDGNSCEIIDVLPARGNDPAEIAERHEQLRLAIGALPSLSPLERAALARAVDGDPCAEKRMDNALQRARRKMAAAA